ncbi:AbrB/MazE/SpoVT family DNA-binding domain-containing protein [Halobellus salinisoli]|uniref:AbrB/MazE/SpoVT family DNA-binding domain-containing protein n=1 Tax=Halobellus salinisoli TaxID=3108500 RepID=UPI00300AD689
METRKIQRVSHGTYTVSLPREWATEQDLTAGDVVNIHPSLDGALVVQPAEDELARIEMRVSEETPRQLTRLLRAAYAVGVLEVDLRTEELATEQQAAIRSTVRTLSGVTIAEESPSHVTVRNVLDSEQISIRQSVRHLQSVALSQHREATATLCDPAVETRPAAGNGHRTHLSAMVERYFVRSLSRLDEVDRLGEARSDLFCFYRLADEFTRIESCADRIATVATADENGCLDGHDNETPAEIEAIAGDTRQAVETAADAVFDPDLTAIWSVFDVRESVDTELDELERRLFESPDVDYRAGRVIAALRGSADVATSIAELALRRGIRLGALDSGSVGDETSTNTDWSPAAPNTED